MNDSELLRYSRHILLPQIGVEGQEKLVAATVLIVGAGGLGCPAALYLGAAGLGTLILADADVVDLTNLQRQIGHNTVEIGRNKAASLRQQILAINPGVEIEALPLRLDGSNLKNLVARADVVLDCTDNFATRHTLNRACVNARKPLVSGAALGFSGQLAVFDSRKADAPCYQCLFPEQPEEGLRCSEAGVLSPMVGVIGALQAVEAIKLVCHVGQTMHGRLLLYDAGGGQFREVRVPKDPECKVCARQGNAE